jgi:hypothetical protein
MEPTKRLQLSELMCTPEWMMLTEKQKVFCSTLISTGLSTGTYDSLAAALEAYDIHTDPNTGAKSMKNAQIISCQLQGNKRVKALLDLHFGRSPVDSLLSDAVSAVQQSLRADKKRQRLSVATVKGLQFLNSVSRGCAVAELDEPATEASSTEKQEPRFKVGDLCMQNEMKFRITAVDENGKPLAAEEVE